MNRRTQIGVLALALAFAASSVACGPKKQPPKDPVDTDPTSEPDPPKPPPPKCEKLDEKCESKGGKKAKIPGSVLVFEPVLGWLYAQGEKATIAQAGEEESCQGLVGYEAPDVKDTKKTDAARQAQLDAIAAELKLNLGKSKVAWKNAEKYDKGKVPLLRWTLEKVTRGAKKGDLLLVATVPSDGKAVFGVAFVPGDDDKSAEKIVTSFDTIAPGEAP